MEKLQSPMKSFTLFLIILTQFSSLVPLSTSYSLPDYYFINCGSQSDTNFGTRLFVGDQSFFVGQSKTVTDSSSSGVASLYQTARVFSGRRSSYQFEINEKGTYIVRLHFFVFSSTDNLTKAVFDVWAYGFKLLSNFSIPQINNEPVIKEFLLIIDVGKFRIYFTPSIESSLAFVNAIEVFLGPENFIPNDATHIASSGSNGNYSGLLSQVLHTVHRINVGGSKLTADNDTLLRIWIPDDDFLSYPGTAKNSLPYDGWLLYRNATKYNASDKYTAPEPVYKTAKVLNTDQIKQSNLSNITWGFKVSKNARYFVRLHFCDIISPSTSLLAFNLHLYNKFSQRISSYDITGFTASPFYFDFFVDSDNSGFMNVSVSPRTDSQIQNAFLNGLEIMAVMAKSGSFPVESKTKSRSILAVSLGGVAFLILIVVLLLILKWKRAKHDKTWGRPFSVPLFGDSFHNRPTERTANMSLPHDFNLALKMPYTEIQRATKNFDAKLLIGEGGFGKVYKGALRDIEVAVKRSEPGHGQGFTEFQTEIMVLSQIRHRHLVSLIGYCDERSEMILVYEFMEKGTLRDHLYASDGKSEKYSSRSELSWEQRLRICIDSAKGLDYLHTGLAGRIIHRDIKSTNILLTKDYTAKVADFGLSKSGPLDPDQDVTGVKGSFGYLDPEYFMSLQLTEKSDVYSFGVVLLEVLCARPVILTSDRREEVNLAEWGMLWQKKGQLEKIIDPVLAGNIDSSSLRKFGEIAEKCLRANSAERPVMHDVLWDLQFALHLQVQQTERNREPYDDDSSVLALQAIQHLPSHNFPTDPADLPFDGDDDTVTVPSGVFSQLRIGHGR